MVCIVNDVVGIATGLTTVMLLKIKMAIKSVVSLQQSVPPVLETESGINLLVPNQNISFR